MTTIQDFLTSANLLNAKNKKGVTYLEAFEDEGIDDLETLFEFEDEELRTECDFKTGHWKKFKKYKDSFKSGGLSQSIPQQVSKQTHKQVPEQKTDENISGFSTKTKQPPKKKVEYFDPVKSKQVSLAFVGMTGAGKTTLLASLRDYLSGKTYDEILTTLQWEEKYATHENWKNRGHSGGGESRTKKVTTYPSKNKEWNVRIIDTPGLADTQGLDEDEKHAKELVRGLANASEFNALCIVLKNGDNRKTIQLEYVVNELMTNFPKSIKNNIIICVTGCDSDAISQETESVLKDLNLPTKNVIPIENKAYSTIKLEKLNDKQLTKHMRKMKVAYEDSHDQLQLLLETAHSLKPYKSHQIDDLRRKKENLDLEFGRVRGIMTECIEQQIDVEKREKQLKEQMVILERIQKDEKKKEVLAKKKYNDLKKVEKDLKSKLNDIKKASDKLQKENFEIDRLELQQQQLTMNLKKMDSDNPVMVLINFRDKKHEQYTTNNLSILNTESQIDNCRSNVEGLEDTVNSNENYTYDKPYTDFEHEDVPRQTRCNYCKQACHLRCSLTDSGIEGCWCIDSTTQYCTQCNCHISEHGWTKVVTKAVTKYVTAVDEIKQKRYIEAKESLVKEQLKLSQLQSTLNHLKEQSNSLNEECDSLDTKVSNEINKRNNEQTKLKNSKQKNSKEITKLEETRKLLKQRLEKYAVEQKGLETKKDAKHKECEKLRNEVQDLKKKKNIT